MSRYTDAELQEFSRGLMSQVNGYIRQILSQVWGADVPFALFIFDEEMEHANLTVNGQVDITPEEAFKRIRQALDRAETNHHKAGVANERPI